MAEKIDIYKDVMAELGQPNPPSITDIKANEVIVFNRQYDTALKKLLSVRFWTFLTTQEELSEDMREDSENARWKYKFQMPDGYLRLNGVYASNMYSGHSVRYTIKNGYIFTDVPQLFIDYVSKPCEQKLPVWFVDYLKYYIARRICIPITGDTQLMDILRQNETDAMKEALSADVCQQPQVDLPTDVFVGCRG